VGVADALNLSTAAWAGLVKAAVHGHFRPEGSHILREFFPCLGGEPVRPRAESLARGGVETIPLVWLELLGERNWGKLRSVKDFVRVCVADAADQSWIGEGALERAVLRR